MVFSRYFDERDKNTGQPWWSFAQERGIDAASMALGAAWQEHVDAKRQEETPRIERHKSTALLEKTP